MQTSQQEIVEAMDLLADQAMYAGRHINDLIRDRIRATGFKFCDDEGVDEGDAAARDTWRRCGDELKITGIGASSTDHETQVRPLPRVNPCAVQARRTGVSRDVGRQS